MGNEIHATCPYKLSLLRKRYNRRKKVKYSGVIYFCRVCKKPRLNGEGWLYYCSNKCYRIWYNAKRVKERENDKHPKDGNNRHCLKCGKPNQKNWFCKRCRWLNKEIEEVYTPGALGIEFYELDIDVELTKQIDTYKLMILGKKSFIYGWDILTKLKNGG